DFPMLRFPKDTIYHDLPVKDGGSTFYNTSILVPREICGALLGSRGAIKDVIQGDCFSFDIDLWQVDRRERLIHLQGTPRQLYEAQTRIWIKMFEVKAWNHKETYLPEMKPTPYPLDYPRILQMNPAE
ncbi:unnamed protein product, partial [Allacma fusca]